VFILWMQFPFVRFEVFTAVTMKNGVFWDVTLCGSCKNRSYSFHLLVFIIFFVFFCFVCFRSPLISCASACRAGETKNDAYPKLKTLLR
jgi:hypothetical protein